MASTEALRNAAIALVLEGRNALDNLENSDSIVRVVEDLFGALMTMVEEKLYFIEGLSNPPEDWANIPHENDTIYWLELQDDDQADNIIGFVGDVVESLEELAKLEALKELGDSPSADARKAELRDRIVHMTALSLGLMENATDGFLERIKGLQPVDAQWQASKELRQWRDSLRGKQSLASATAKLLEVSSAADEVKTYARDAAEAVGATGSGSIAEYYENFAKSQNREGLFWRGISIALAIIGLVVTYIHITATATLSWQEALQKSALGFPLSVIIGISIYEGNVHRRHALWSSHVAIQIRSIRAYTDEMEAGVRASIREAFALAVFRGPTMDLDGEGGARGVVDAERIATAIFLAQAKETSAR